ncbi:hypothetical protein [Actibacterium sp. 188UL27-1]|uniref:hypothetical protein n=1 Tax=Actibacterium sp. 188UL27-1 TaxID=2786961 RepID=UPI00195653D3|nr:hypothetical protein [Actibacterium sp. 188UL27-1]MBM7066553.1 hypothetical protein [Actibacterium sp. 188UL27-1]
MDQYAKITTGPSLYIETFNLDDVARETETRETDGSNATYLSNMGHRDVVRVTADISSGRMGLFANARQHSGLQSVESGVLIAISLQFDTEAPSLVLPEGMFCLSIKGTLSAWAGEYAPWSSNGAGIWLGAMIAPGVSSITDDRSGSDQMSSIEWEMSLYQTENRTRKGPTHGIVDFKLEENGRFSVLLRSQEILLTGTPKRLNISATASIRVGAYGEVGFAHFDARDGIDLTVNLPDGYRADALKFANDQPGSPQDCARTPAQIGRDIGPDQTTGTAPRNL